MTVKIFYKKEMHNEENKKTLKHVIGAVHNTCTNTNHGIQYWARGFLNQYKKKATRYISSLSFYPLFCLAFTMAFRIP